MPLWIDAIHWLSRSVLGILFGLSIWSVATMIRSSRLLKNAGGPSGQFDTEMGKIREWVEARQWDSFREWASSRETVHAGAARAILQTSSDSGQIDRAVRSYLGLERTRLESGLTVLATLGSNAPFIGLFGTVLGIIQAFAALGAHQNNAADIMVGISEALIATAVGLFVAIPAVVAFNVFTRKLKVILAQSESLKDLYLSKLPRS